MTPSTTLCQQYEQPRRSPFGNGLTLGRYVVAAACDTLPQEVHRDGHIVCHGYAVGFGEWMFFPAIEPAVAFGRAARMSLDCHGWGVYEAAQERCYCERHHQDEVVLLILISKEFDQDAEVDQMKRFVQSVKEHPWSSHWLPPTGYITDYNRGNPIKTTRRSLPL
jgi:hypothetical protein